MRSVLALAASGLAALAAVISSLDKDGDLVPFFVALTVAGGVVAWAAHPPFHGARRRLAGVIAWAWLIAGAWVGILLGMFVSSASSPPPLPEATYLGLSATIYHLLGLYGGLVLIMLAVYGREGRLDRVGPDAETEIA